MAQNSVPINMVTLIELVFVLILTILAHVIADKPMLEKKVKSVMLVDIFKLVFLVEHVIDITCFRKTEILIILLLNQNMKILWSAPIKMEKE